MLRYWHTCSDYNDVLSVQGTVMLTIGYHQLEGKRQALKKPMALLSKADADSQGADGSDQLAYKVRWVWFTRRLQPHAKDICWCAVLSTCLDQSSACCLSAGGGCGERKVSVQVAAQSLDNEATPQGVTITVTPVPPMWSRM